MSEKSGSCGIKSLYDRIIPKYSRIPLLCVLLFNCLAYWTPQLILDGSRTFDLSIGLDGLIPFCSFFILFYVLAYLQWGVGYIVIGRENREYCHKVVTADLIAKFICFLFFVILPTTIERPELTGDGLFEWMTGLIYNADTPINLFPSIHCLESYVVFRCALPLKKVGCVYKAVMLFISVGVFMSVVFVKQHFFVDIPAGILLFELALFATDKLKLYRFFTAVMAKIKR